MCSQNETMKEDEEKGGIGICANEGNKGQKDFAGEKKEGSQGVLKRTNCLREQ